MTGFPNYAGRQDVDDALRSELADAGIEVFDQHFFGRREVKSGIVGHLHGLVATRAPPADYRTDLRAEGGAIRREAQVMPPGVVRQTCARWITSAPDPDGNACA